MIKVGDTIWVLANPNNDCPRWDYNKLSGTTGKWLEGKVSRVDTDIMHMRFRKNNIESTEYNWVFHSREYMIEQFGFSEAELDYLGYFTTKSPFSISREEVISHRITFLEVD